MIEASALVGVVSFGLLGTAHCAGMCGPLAIGACGRGRPGALRSAGAYLFGRFVSYALGGAVVGTLGRHALCRLPFREVETAVAVAVGLVALARGIRLLAEARGKVVPLRKKARSGRGVGGVLAPLLPGSALGLGLVTGFLPCGMLVSSLAIAAATASPASGALVMTAFAVATLPGLVGPMVLRRVLADRLASPALVAAGWCALGVAMLARPLVVGAHCVAAMAP